MPEDTIDLKAQNMHLLEMLREMGSLVIQASKLLEQAAEIVNEKGTD